MTLEQPQILQQTHFTGSAASPHQFPPDIGAEIAFVGRSNAGKSSAINRIAMQSRLARTSKTPGRTQLINFFQIQDYPWRVVDLPGYGFAKVPKAMKQSWEKLIDLYLRQRSSLQGLFLIMDIRHPMQDFDKLILTWADQTDLKCHILLTKADKFKFGRAKSILLDVQKQTSQLTGVSCQIFSSNTDIGWEFARYTMLTWYGETPDTPLD